MKTRRIAAAVLFTFLPATVSLPAWSQDDPVTTQARARFKEGVDAFDKGKFEEARLSFLQAYTLKKHPSVLLNLAQSSAKSNHPAEAAKYFQQFLKEASSATPQQRKDAEAGLGEVRQKLGRIDVTAPAGTEISLDDQGRVGTAPIEPIDVEPGQHTVKSPTQSVTVIAIVGQKVDAKLGSSPAVAPINPVAATPPPPATEPPPPEDKQVDGTVHTRSTNLFSPPENMTPVYIGLAVGGLGLASGVIFGLFRNDAQSKADTVSNDIVRVATERGIAPTGACNNPNAPEFADACQTLKDNNSKVDTNATIANVSFVVMGAGIVVAGLWYVAATKREEGKESPAPGHARAPRGPVVAPYGGWNNGGLSLTGEF